MSDKNWSVGLEHGEYEDDINLVINDALEAIRETGKGFYVNVVTPGVFGNPEAYLTKHITETFKDSVMYKFIDQCGCGGYVLRVWKNK